MGHCYSCGSTMCSDTSQIHLNATFCSLQSSINTDCTTLGYTTRNRGNGLCPDGTEGLKCVFDSSYMFCNAISTPVVETCTSINHYDDLSDCESNCSYGLCEPNDVTTPSGKSLTCITCACSYSSKEACEWAMEKSVCDLNQSNCYAPISCKAGYCGTKGYDCYTVCDTNTYKYLFQSTLILLVFYTNTTIHFRQNDNLFQPRKIFCAVLFQPTVPLFIFGEKSFDFVVELR